MKKEISQFISRHLEQILLKLETSNKPLDLLLSQHFRSHKSLGAQDRRTLGNILYGMTRWKSLLDHFSPKDRVSFYLNLNWSEVLHNETIPPHAKLGLSEFLYTQFLSHYGAEKGEALGRILNETAPTTLRTNFLKITREKLIEILEKKFPVSPSTRCESAIHLQKREPLFALPEFKEGLFEMQDEGSQLVAKEIQALPGDIVLDYCSGSGGKTLAFAPAMKGKGQIYLHDIRTSALIEARQRLKRAGIQNGQCLPKGHIGLTKILGKCDWVLIDVPCSGSGTLRRNPDQKWKITPAMVEKLIQEQREIAKDAIQYLKPQARLVYATCSLLPQENEEQVKYLLENFPLSLEKEPALFFPESNGIDGFFCAVFKKHKL